MRLSQAFDWSLGFLMSAQRCWVVLVQLDRSLQGPEERAGRWVKLQHSAELIVPDRSHTRAVNLVAAVENLCTSQCMLLLF